jgi:uncharacterized membrane protein
MKDNYELRAAARAQLKGNWGEAIGLMLIYSIIIGASSMVVGIGELVVTGPLTLGCIGYFSRKVRSEEAQIENLFEGFKTFLPSFVLFLLQAVFIALWSLLLFVPGIVKSFSYSMSYYILRDNPGMGASQAITASRKMMKGYKGKLFGLYLSFFGWGILCVITFGIGSLWLGPYMMQTSANFYEELKLHQAQTPQE